jgi:protein gp37
MGQSTEIAWTDATWNPWQGCHKLSPACANCYMFRDKARYGQDANTVVRSSDATFCKPLVWAKNREKYGHINRVFTCSWSDFFIEESDPWRSAAWEIIQYTPQLSYQILTKRPERIGVKFPEAWFADFDHVQLGTTTENQKCFDERAPHIYASGSGVPFISCEPMLGPLRIMGCADWLKWVIVGCESGPKSRETKIEWVRDLRDQCAEAGIPFFLKQLMIDGKLTTTPFLDGKQHIAFPKYS